MEMVVATRHGGPGWCEGRGVRFEALGRRRRIDDNASAKNDEVER
ncbi:hypothetical protein C7S14_7813 [Burkholderia cepacia]|nr:hypothetical protein C7S14_7813 [Burkholderia cepacia]